MKEAIGGTWILGLVITFIVFFASFLAVSINYAKAFNVKNNVVDLIEKYEGNNCNARKKITEYLQDVGYLVSGPCETGYKAYGLDGNEEYSGKGYYCVSTDGTGEDTTLDKKFYRVKVFFKFDFPLVGELFTFKIKGETESIYFAKDDNLLAC